MLGIINVLVIQTSSLRELWDSAGLRERLTTKQSYCTARIQTG